LASFWTHVDLSNPIGCWPWLKGTDRGGYGKLGNVRAHRHAWTLTYGPIPAGLVICHACDNPPCCRPDHLFVGTPADNTNDMKAKGRQPRLFGVMNAAAKLTEDDVRAIRRAYAAGGAHQREIARRFGVGQMTVSLIVRRKRWAHIA
jgi:hypothetical protein